jgi:hypothetical protein
LIAWNIHFRGRGAIDQRVIGHAFVTLRRLCRYDELRRLGISARENAEEVQDV